MNGKEMLQVLFKEDGELFLQKKEKEGMKISKAVRDRFFLYMCQLEIDWQGYMDTALNVAKDNPFKERAPSIQ